MNTQEKLVACICEGNAEREILEILLDNEMLEFSWDNLLDNEISKYRKAKDFQKRYLGRSFKRKITVYRFLDSRSEKFNLGLVYKNKADVIDVITAPEIEMLIIFNENKYKDFKKSGLKPSVYCKQILKMRKVKEHDFMKDYFSDVNKLVAAIKEYKRVSKIPKGEKCLYDLLKNKC